MRNLTQPPSDLDTDLSPDDRVSLNPALPEEVRAGTLDAAVDRRLNDWRATGQVSYHLMIAMRGAKNADRIVDRVIFGDRWTRDEACGDLYEILYQHALVQIRRQAGLDEAFAAVAAEDLPF